MYSYIFSVYCTYMFRSLLTIIRVLVVTECSNSTICAYNYIFDECTYCWVAVLRNNEHPDDGQQIPKHICVINWEKIHCLCILLVLFNNYAKNKLTEGLSVEFIARDGLCRKSYLHFEWIFQQFHIKVGQSSYACRQLGCPMEGILSGRNSFKMFMVTF
jgi:hypothetical protein